MMMMGCVTAMAGTKKLSLSLQQLLAARITGDRHQIRGKERVCAFVKFVSPCAEQLFARYGCELVTQTGDIYIARIPIDQLEAMAACDDVERIETQLGGKQLLDVAPQWIDNEPVRLGEGLPQGYDGTGVLLGIVDGGFDLTHPSFYGADGTTYRIKGFVDDYYGEEETLGVLTPLGREYTKQADILAKQHSGDSEGYHGSHCLGIAAGSGYGSPYRGIASGADIFAITSSNASESYYANSADQVARMKRIFDYADQTHQPCVITYSIGFNDLPDDSRLFGEALESLTGPGRIVVVAAGNEGYKDTYVHKPSGKDTAGTGVTLNKKRAWAYLVSDQPFKLKCLTMGQAALGYSLTDSVIFDTDHLPADSTIMRGHHLFLRKEGSFYTLADRMDVTWNGDLEGLLVAIEGEDADVEMYVDEQNEFANISKQVMANPRFRQAESNHNVALPGVLPSVVTVGALNGRESYVNSYGQTIKGWGETTPVGTLAEFSSTGPTRDGRIKPDVVAPGVNVVSSGNSYNVGGSSGILVSTTHFKGRKYPWIALSGTSMATPCAAGIVALWLQADPTLTPERVKEVISASSRQPVKGMDSPNSDYGYGLIDAYAGMLQVLDIPSAIASVSTRQPSALRIRPVDGRRLRLTFDAAPSEPFVVRVYTVSGQLLCEQTLHPTAATVYTVTLPQASEGILVVQVNSAEQGVTGSELVRL